MVAMFSPATTAPSRDVMCNHPQMNSLALTCNWPIAWNTGPTIHVQDAKATIRHVTAPTPL